MEIILESADFSANNIGKITVQRTFSDTTKGILSTFGITENTSNSVQIALDDFVSALTTANLWGTKIKSLCLPFLSQIAKSGDLTYAQKNVIDGTNFFSSTMTSTSLELASHGFKVVDGGTVAKVNFKSKVGTDNYHMAGYNMTAEVIDQALSNGSFPNRYIFGGAYSILALMKCNASLGKVVSMQLSGSAYVNGDANYNSASALVIGNVQYTDMTNKIANTLLSVNGQATTKTEQTVYGNSIPTTYNFGVYNSSTYSKSLAGTSNMTVATEASWGLLSVGTALTADECSAYNNAVTALMTVVKTMS